MELDDSLSTGLADMKKERFRMRVLGARTEQRLESKGLGCTHAIYHCALRRSRGQRANWLPTCTTVETYSEVSVSATICVQQHDTWMEYVYGETQNVHRHKVLRTQPCYVTGHPHWVLPLMGRCFEGCVFELVFQGLTLR